MRKTGITAFAFLFLAVSVYSQNIEKLARNISEKLSPVYRHLHANPELSLNEKETATFLQKRLKQLGYKLIGPFGGHGFVGVLENGSGPVILVRADMDALPVKEATGVSYASTVVVSEHNKQTPVMHACGHDIHMTSWLGTAEIMAKSRSHWQGTLIMLAQPAEEFGDGARNMLQDGLFKKIPKPDYALALHVSADLAAGTIGYTGGYAYANVDAMQIMVKGKGGHGAYPHTTIDPVVLASRIILALQTLVSREFSPLEPLVITVGAIDGGTKGNIIADNVNLQMTIRYHNESLRPHILSSIKRLCDGLAQSAGLTPDDYPELKYYPENLPGVYNDPELTNTLAAIWIKTMTADRVYKVPATLGGEDFGRFGNTSDDIPICIYWVGSVDPQRLESQASSYELPSLHSPKFLPLETPTLKTGIESMSYALIGLFQTQNAKD